jgi:hypothetical protein
MWGGQPPEVSYLTAAESERRGEERRGEERRGTTGEIVAHPGWMGPR